MQEATKQYKQILLLTNMYPSTQFPAKGSFVKRSAEQLMHAGFTVKVLSLGGNRTKVLEYALLYIKIIRRLVFESQSHVYIHFVSHIALPVLVSALMRRLLLKQPHNIVSHVHGGDIHLQVNKNKWFFWVKSIFAKLILKQSNVIITPSNRYATLVTELLAPKPMDAKKKQTSEIRVICSGGVDLDKFKSVELPQNASALSSLKFIYLSRFEPLKQPLLTLDYLADLHKQKPSCFESAKFFGFGSQGDAVQKQVAKLLKNSMQVSCYEAVPSEQVPTLLAAHDAFILQSKEESLGLAPLEAMAAGCVVFLSNIPAFKEFIDDGVNGFIISTQEEFIRKVADFCSWSSERQHALRKAARETVLQRYSSSMAERDLISVFSIDKHLNDV